MSGEDEGFNRTIDLLWRATGWKSDRLVMTTAYKCSAVMMYNDRQTPEEAKAWFQRAFELTL